MTNNARWIIYRSVRCGRVMNNREYHYVRTTTVFFHCDYTYISLYFYADK